MPNQPRNCTAQVYREKPGFELGEMPLYGQPGNNIGAYYFRKKGSKLIRQKST